MKQANKKHKKDRKEGMNMNYLKKLCSSRSRRVRGYSATEEAEQAAEMLSAEEEATAEKPRKSPMIVLRRKQIVAVSLIVLIGVASYLNWTFTNDRVDPDVAAMYTQASKKLGEAQMVVGDTQEMPENTASASPMPQEGSGYFSQAKMDRDVKRSESVEMLMNIVNNPNTDKESREKAEADVSRLADNTEIETNIENQIRAKGFANAIAFLTADPADGSKRISIAVATEGLNKQDAAVIQEIVTVTAGLKAEQMTLVEIKPQ